MGEIVSAFQKLTESLIRTHSNKDFKVNDFQIVSKRDAIFIEYTGKYYRNWVSYEEYSLLNLIFQRRHLLEHNFGIVDDKYLNKSKMFPTVQAKDLS